MKKKIGLAFVGLVLMMITLFAPSTNAPAWPPAPTVQTDKYIVMGGEAKSCVQLWMGGAPVPPFEWNCPFGRAPYFTPTTMWQSVNFSVPVDPDGPGPLPTCVVFLTVPNATIKSLSHVYFSPTLGYTKVDLIPQGNGMGWLYLLPGISDVDIYTYNTYVPPPTNKSLSFWLPRPRPNPGKSGTVASSAAWGGFPDPGPDNLPGFLPTSDDGFGDNTPDPAGSSVLFMPFKLSVSSWNGTAWVFKFGGPFILPMTTATAYDIAVLAGAWINGKNATMTGHPWENIATTGHWGDNKDKVWVTYACVWSFIQYQLTPIYKLDILYALTEKKVKEDAVVPDITCDNAVTIFDVATAAKAFGSRDEGIPAYPGYVPPAWWPNQVALGKGPYVPAWIAVFGCPYTVFADPNFDARADLDNNGLIDIFDVCRIAKYYGQAVDP